MRTLPDLTGLHVLIIEDDDDQREALARLLQLAGAVVDQVAAAEHAVDQMAQALPHAVVCDLQLPGMDGIAFVQKLQDMAPPEVRRVPVIGVTGRYEILAPAEARALGFAAFMRKPVETGALCETIRRVVSSSRSR